MYKKIMIANVHEIRVFESDTQDFVLTILAGYRTVGIWHEF
jgi:hypothetical protein